MKHAANATGAAGLPVLVHWLFSLGGFDIPAPAALAIAGLIGYGLTAAFHQQSPAQ